MFIGLLDGGGTARRTALRRSLAMLLAFAVILVGGSGLAVAAEDDPAPIPVVEPSGVVRVDSGASIVLDASTSTSTNDGGLTFAWWHDEVEDKGATGETYEVKDPDGIRTVQVKVTDSTGASAMSDPIVLVFGTPETQEAAISASTEEPLKIGEKGTWSLKESEGLYPSTKYTWYVDGGYLASGVVADGKDFVYAPIFPGKHRVTLLLRNALGERSYTSSEFEATNGVKPDAVILPADEPLTIKKGEEITFDGSTSTGDGALLYSWTSSQSGGEKSRQAKYTAKFDVPGRYRVGLRVIDRSKRSDYASKYVTVLGDGPPVARITPGEDQTVPVGTTLSFDSSKSEDPDGDLAGRWWYSSGVPGIASTDTVYERKFDRGGVHTVRLQVKDPEGNADLATVNITVTDKAPVATFTPGADQTVPVGTNLKFDGSGSTDPEKSKLRYSWFTTGIPGEVSDTDSYARRFTDPGKYRVRMFVYDVSNNRSEKVVEITVKGEAPVVDFTPGTDQTVTRGTSITFNGSKSYDPNGGDIRFRWYTTGIPGVVSDTATYTRRFSAPGKYRVKLLGYNSINKVAYKIVEITVT